MSASMSSSKMGLLFSQVLFMAVAFLVLSAQMTSAARMRPEKRYLMNFRAPNFEDQLAALFENPVEPVFSQPQRGPVVSNSPSSSASKLRANMCMNYITGDFFDC
ncbi:uncharacterized protein LOC134842036 [Symsagittifera roscoffensis]|uniref:uncharacterized protein LOC134842036 n=1 Tax=Symsagittifera roscoffensis TaxID=84072 RepID=UPI00307B881F